MKRTLTISMAIIGFIATSACSRSGSSNPPIKQDPQAVSTPIPNAEPELDSKSGKSSVEDKGSNKADNRGPVVPAPVPIVPRRDSQKGPQPSNDRDPSNGSRNNNQNNNSNSGNQNAQPVTPVQNTAPSNGPQAIVYDPTGLTPTEIFDRAANQAPDVGGNPSNVTNGQSGEILNYSGAGQDSLREQLQNFVDNKATRIATDKEFAKRVSNGRFSVNWSNRTAVLNVAIKGASGPVNYRFSGALDNSLFLRAGDLRHGNQVSIEAACMDLNGGCNTVYAKVQNATGGKVRTAHMLIRQTEATLFTQADGFGLARNEEFDRLLRTLVRTVDHSGDRESVSTLTLRTSETINGQSSFKVEFGLRAANGADESLNIGGPLVKPAADYALDASAQLLRSTSPIAGTIRGISLIKNDGHGDLQLAITVRKATAEASEDTANVTIARIHKPTRVLIVK